MYKVVRIAGGVLLGVTLCIAILFLWGDVSHIWQWLKGTHEWFIPFGLEEWLWILLFLGLGLGLVKSADRRESQRAAIPMPPSNDPSVGYLRQHWRGEHSLARSFWVNTVLCSFALYGLFSFLLNHSDDIGVSKYDAPVFYALSFYIVSWALFFALTFWQLMGMLRAAQRRINHASSFWSWDSARVVRMLVGISSLAVFYPLVFHAVPDIYEGAMIVLEDMADDKYTLNVRNGGAELEIRGRMRFGLTEEVNRYIAMNPRIRVIHLNSPGGRALEGEGLFNLIRKHQLITYSSIECSSACTLAFMGGSKRYINKYASLGFHSSWTYSGLYLGIDNSPSENLYNVHDNVMRRLKLYTIEAGADRGYAEKLFSSLAVYPMTYPTPEELLKAGVVHGFIEGVNFTLPDA